MGTLFIISRFFECFKAQPRLAMVTGTIASAMVDLFHNLIVLFVFWMSYAIAGMLIFGKRVHKFSSLDLAINTCFLTMMGDFDFDEIGAEHPITAALWFWTFMVILSMIELN